MLHYPHSGRLWRRPGPDWTSSSDWGCSIDQSMNQETYLWMRGPDDLCWGFGSNSSSGCGCLAARWLLGRSQSGLLAWRLQGLLQLHCGRRELHLPRQEERRGENFVFFPTHLMIPPEPLPWFPQNHSPDGPANQKPIWVRRLLDFLKSLTFPQCHIISPKSSLSQQPFPIHHRAPVTLCPWIITTARL